jgi:hypothetical protein
MESWASSAAAAAVSSDGLRFVMSRMIAPAPVIEEVER